MIDVHYVDSSVEGWQIFRVTQALEPRLNRLALTDPTHIGFLVTAVSATGRPMLLHVSRRRDRHANRQPLLVLFNDDTSVSSSHLDVQSQQQDSVSTSDTKTSSGEYRASISNCRQRT